MNRVEEADKIMDVVVKFTNLSKEQIQSQRRLGDLVMARNYFVYLAKKYYHGHRRFTSAFLGAYLGGRHHSSVLAIEYKLRQLMMDKEFQRDITDLEALYHEENLSYEDRIALAAGEYTKQIEQWQKELTTNTLLLKNLIEQDPKIEEWKRDKVLKLLKSIDEQSKRFEGISSLYEDVKLNLINEIHEERV